mmetsp:Transcript_12327/g.37587  ORF Transcript_12327/g.37587 Transcript_12327/m.37587 type:complete len:317 (-) Transcript_12327:184-1134(-)
MLRQGADLMEENDPLRNAEHVEITYDATDKELEKRVPVSRARRTNLKAFIGFVAFLLVGVGWFMTWSGWTFSRSLYFCIVTITTVGYGDIVPLDYPSKLFVVLYVISVIAAIATLLSVLIEGMIDDQLKAFTKVMERAQAGQLGSEKKSYYALARASLAWFLVIIGIGLAFFVLDQKMNFVDALYLTVISSSTVGFGDLHIKPDTKAELVTSVWLIFATIGLAKVAGDFTNAHAQKQQDEMAAQVLKSALRSVSDFGRIDSNADGKVSRAEFLVAILVRTEKIPLEDINKIMDRFDELDTDKSGFVELNEVDGLQL